jgi:nicotinamide-nucleotide amidase
MSKLSEREKHDLHVISTTLQRLNESVAVAESVTAGLIQARLSLAREAMQFFQGGLTAYNLGQKAKHLQVDPILADKCNCVSSRVSAQMALGIAKKFNAQWGLAVTGYAAPVPDLEVHACFCHYTFVRNYEVVLEHRIESELTDIIEVQSFYVAEIIHHFSEVLATTVDPAREIGIKVNGS